MHRLTLNNGEFHLNTITRPNSPELDAILGQPFECLDKGFVRVIDYMGNDAAIVQMARVSYGEGTKTVNEDRGLIRYLMRHDHTSPFEGCELKLHLKMPIFIARQWIRHRMASLNEYSGRYSVMKDEFYFPHQANIAVQSEENKQGRGAAMDIETAERFLETLQGACTHSYADYQDAIEAGVSREVARIGLPLNLYTEFYWKIDLHNLLHFLRLRADSHAQYEIRVYAETIKDIVRQWVPHTYEAAVDYRFNAVKLSAGAIDAVRHLITNTTGKDLALFIRMLEENGIRGRELKETKAIFGILEA